MAPLPIRDNDAFRALLTLYFRNRAAYNAQYPGVAINDWDTRNVTDMSRAFMNQTGFNEPLDRWNTSNVVSMEKMFDYARDFNQPLNAWNVSKVTTMFYVFNDAHAFNQPLDRWDVSNVENMRYAFSGARTFNQPLNSWNVSNVTAMGGMFNQAASFNQPLNNWDVGRVTTANDMFRRTPVFNQPLNDWNVGQMMQLASMFEEARSFNQPLDRWDMRNARFMDSMFKNATAFNQPLDAWTFRLRPTVYAANMFLGATAFHQDLSAWTRFGINLRTLKIGRVEEDEQEEDSNSDSTLDTEETSFSATLPPFLTTQPTRFFATQPNPSFPTPSFATQPTRSFATQPTPSFATQPTPSFSTPSFATQPTPSFPTPQPTPSFATQPTPSFPTPLRPLSPIVQLPHVERMEELRRRDPNMHAFLMMHQEPMDDPLYTSTGARNAAAVQARTDRAQAIQASLARHNQALKNVPPTSAATAVCPACRVALDGLDGPGEGRGDRANDVVRVCANHHRMHRGCILPSCEHNPVCPECRGPLTLASGQVVDGRRVSCSAFDSEPAISVSTTGGKQPRTARQGTSQGLCRGKRIQTKRSRGKIRGKPSRGRSRRRGLNRWNQSHRRSRKRGLRSR